MELDFELLNKALDNDKNEDIIYLSMTTIQNIKEKMYMTLCINHENDIIKINKQLRYYMYVDTIDKLKLGDYLRWFKNNETYLQQGGFLKDVTISNENINLVMKSINNRSFTISFNDIYVFRKITNQEQILLKAIELCS